MQNQSDLLSYVVGIDVGGTNTDLVLLENGKMIYSTKADTTVNVTDGITRSLQNLLQATDINPDAIQIVKLGTTHLLNATLQNNLSRVAAIRLGLPATTSIPPGTGWPAATRSRVVAINEMIDGGYEYSGKPIKPLNKEQLREIARKIIAKKITFVSISGVFAHINPNQEIEAATMLKEILDESQYTVQFSLSHKMGGIGLLERENATILNAALLPVYQRVCRALQKSLRECGLINATALLSHNDGSLEPINEDQQTIHDSICPIFTLNAGQTNSMRGGAALAESLGVRNVIIADIGGTSTDVGRIQDGKPAEVNTFTKIAEIPLNLQTVEGKSIGLGGGSIIHVKPNGFSIGPRSVSNKLKAEAISFGGHVLTATDIAIYQGRIKDDLIQATIQHLDDDIIHSIDHALHEMLAKFISDIWHASEEKPEHLMLIGGGRKLFDYNLLSEKLRSLDCLLIIIEHPDASVANALGASMSEISGTYVQLFDYSVTSSDEAEKIVEGYASEIAIKRGADPKSIKRKFKKEEVIPYVRGSPTILTLKVAGQIKSGFSSVPSNTPQKNPSTWDDPVECSEDEDPHVPAVAAYQNEIEARAIGCAFLGSGGGGDTRFVELMLQECFTQKKPVELLSLEQLPDEATVISFGIVGAPTIFDEKLPSKDEFVRTILAMQQHMGKKIDAIVAAEIGGLNGLLSLIAVLQLAADEFNIRLLDADCMGRALPAVNMVTPAIFNKFDQCVAIVSSQTDTEILTADNFLALENKVREYACEIMGGVVTLATTPMSGKAAKEVCIPGTLTLSQKMGEAFLDAKKSNKNILESMNEVLKETDYEKIEEVFSGRIVVRRKEAQGFSFGLVTITNDLNETAEVIFQNENLFIRKILPGGYYKELEAVPNLIVIVDKETMLPISCAQLKYGQQVRVLTMKSPKQLLKPEALTVVGREAFDIERMCQLINLQPPNRDMFPPTKQALETEATKDSKSSVQSLRKK